QLGRSLALRRYVEQVALPLQRTPVRVADRGRLVTHPHCSSVACDQPVLASRRAVALGFEPDLVEDALAVVGMKDLREQLRVLAPVLRRVPEDLRGLRA